jgi:glycosyltransferase involved in cell wall biosynthesis
MSATQRPSLALVASDMSDLGGMETVMLRTARWWRDGGGRVVLVSTRFHQAIQGIESSGLELRRLEGPAKLQRYDTIGPMRDAVAAAIGDCAVVNVHNFPAWVWVHHARPARLIVSCHEPPRHLYDGIMEPFYLSRHAHRRPWYTRQWDYLMWHRWRREDQAAMRAAPEVLTNSLYTAGKIQQVYGRAATATYFGAPEASALPAVERQPGASPVLLWVGRMTEMKNLRSVIEALPAILARQPVELRVVGEGDERERLEARANELGVTGRIRFLGTVTDGALAREYAAADVIVYVPFDEPMGLVPMEAARYGVPSVVSSHGGPAEVVDDGETGLHVDPLEPAAIAEAVLRLCGDAALRQRLGQAARHKIERDMSFERYANIFEQTILRLVRGDTPLAPQGRGS